MPISIKNTLMSYKKSNGDYVNVDAISDNNSKIIYAACTGIITNPNKPTEGSYNRRQININVPENYVAEVDHYIIITFPVNEYYVPQQLYAVHFNYLGNNTDSDVRVSGLGNLNVLNSESTIFDEGSSYLFRYSADLTWKIIGYRQGPKGDKGETGPQGLQGPQGIQGEPGSEYTVMIQNDEPSERSNKIWIPDTDGQTVTVPTVDSDGSIEFEGAISVGRKSNSSKGNKSVAIGNENSATGSYSVAFGENSNATSRSAFAFGLGVSATDAGTMVIGAYNKSLGTYRSWLPNYNNTLGVCVIRNRKVYRCIVPNKDATFDESKWEAVPWGGPRAFIIGNGTENNKSNAMVVDWKGNLELAGNLTIGSTRITEAQLQELLSLIS